jgi:hypothetical protein
MKTKVQLERENAELVMENVELRTQINDLEASPADIFYGLLVAGVLLFAAFAGGFIAGSEDVKFQPPVSIEEERIWRYCDYRDVQYWDYRTARWC